MRYYIQIKVKGIWETLYTVSAERVTEALKAIEAIAIAELRALPVCPTIYLCV